MEFPPFEQPSYTYRAKVVKVIDGDTIDVELDVGFNTHIYKRLRFLGIDTWEVRGEEKPKGLIAKARLEELVQDQELYVQTVMDGEGKYGRVLAWLWIDTDNGMVNVNNLLLEEGHGLPA